ncbi:hypothetical protein ACLOJK_037214 [Asimina triloba]
MKRGEIEISVQYLVERGEIRRLSDDEKMSTPASQNRERTHLVACRLRGRTPVVLQIQEKKQEVERGET